MWPLKVFGIRSEKQQIENEQLSKFTSIPIPRILAQETSSVYMVVTVHVFHRTWINLIELSQLWQCRNIDERGERLAGIKNDSVLHRN